MEKSQKLAASEFSEVMLSVLRECFQGAEKHGAFLDPGPNGLLNLLRKVTAKEASGAVAGASIATHALHVAFSLDAFIGWIQGVRDVEYDWEASWARHEVGEEEWDALLERLQEQHGLLEKAVQENAVFDRDAFWGAAGVLAHTAYHLGIIQVKIDALEAGQRN